MSSIKYRDAANNHRILSGKATDVLFIVQLVLSIVALLAVVGYVYNTNAKVAEINRRQISVVQQQNEQQICTQHSVTRAIRSIARSLGLPTDQITLPSIEGINCDQFLPH